MTTPAASENPQQAGDFWVYPTIDEIVDGSVLVHVAIAVDEAEALRADEVSVELSADGRVLDVAQAPPDGVLPVIRMVGANAYAQYRFANPDNALPTAAAVSVRGGSTSFDLSFPVV